MEFAADGSLDAAEKEQAKLLREQKELLRSDIFAAKMPNSMLFTSNYNEESEGSDFDTAQSYMDSILSGLVSDFLVLKLRQYELELEAWQQGKKVQLVGGASKGSRPKLKVPKQPGSTPLPEFVSRGLALPYLLRKNAGDFCLPGEEAPSQWALLTIEVHLREAQSQGAQAKADSDFTNADSGTEIKNPVQTESEPWNSNVYLSLSVVARLHLSGLISEKEIASLSLSQSSGTETLDHASQLRTNLLPKGFLKNLQTSFERNLKQWVGQQPEKVSTDVHNSKHENSSKFLSALSVTAPSGRDHATGEIFFQPKTLLHFSKTVVTQEMIGYQGISLEESSQDSGQLQAQMTGVDSEKSRALSKVLQPDAATSAVLVVQVAKELINASRDDRIAELALRSSQLTKAISGLGAAMSNPGRVESAGATGYLVGSSGSSGESVIDSVA